MKDISTLPTHCRMMRARMDEKRMSQADLAWILGKTPSQVNPVLNGRCLLTAYSVCGYSVALDIPKRELLEAQSVWRLSQLVINEEKSAGIKRRAALATARVAARRAKNTTEELALLRTERARIDKRIAELAQPSIHLTFKASI